jgi:hypothetical protein
MSTHVLRLCRPSDFLTSPNARLVREPGLARQTAKNSIEQADASALRSPLSCIEHEGRRAGGLAATRSQDSCRLRRKCPDGAGQSGKSAT